MGYFKSPTITLLPKSDKDATKKEVTGQLLMNVDEKILNYVLANRIQQWALFRDVRILQYTEINQYDSPY